MRPHVSSLALILSSLSLAQAATHNRRQEGVARPNIADGFMSMFNRINGQQPGQQTVTETVRQTITVGAAGEGGAVTNATEGAVTVTVTVAASTVTVCPGQAQGAVDGDPGGGATALPAVIASGGVGVTVVSVPEEARITSIVGNQPAATDPAASSGNAENPDTASSLAPLPTQSEGLAAPPGLSSASSEASLQTPPGLADPTSVPVAGAPASEIAAPPSNSTLAQLPGGAASSLSSTLNLGGTGGATAPTVVPIPDGAFGGSVGVIPIESAAVPPPALTATPAVANGAAARPTIDVSGLTLSSQLNLGNLGAQKTAAAAAAA